MKLAAVCLALAMGVSCAAVQKAVNPTTSSPDAGGGGSGRSSSGGGAKPRGASYNDDGPLGSMVRTFLRASPAAKLVVEVDYVKGRAPSSSALSHLAGVLREVADKPAGITVQPGNEIAAGKNRWTTRDLQALERSHRSARSGGSTVTMWIVYVDGVYADADGALGVAYSATAAAVFRDRIDDATTAIISAAPIERAVVTHEAGHLLALINIGYTSTIDHEDKANPHHSNNQDSVMYWAVEDLSLKNLLTGGPPDTFDDADKADLAALKAG